MKKKNVLAVVLSAVMTLSTLSLVACGGEEETVYDAGEYGQIQEGTLVGMPPVIPNPGYRFIDWSDPVAEGNKTIYKAQYEYAEYYLSEVKDVYEFAQGYQDGPSVMRKITNMQTNVTEESIMPLFYVDIEYSQPDIIDITGGDCFQTNILPYEFDITAKVTINDTTYNLHKEFNLHFVRNRIPAESISVEAWSSGRENCVSKGSPCRMFVTTVPDNASYTECEFQILSIERGGQKIDDSLIDTIAYMHSSAPYLYVTEDAQTGDVIYVRAVNKRDPQVVSDILRIVVY